MKKIKLPPIVGSVKKRPLGIDPISGAFVYYDELERGSKKILPVENLTLEQQIALAVERQLTNVPSTTVVLTGETFTNEQLANEIKNQSKIGKQMLKADIDYLKFYLSQFPKECIVK
jgi:hypothetical protein